MAIEARVNPTWAWKWTIMATFALGFAAFCVYDALISYPAQNLRVAAYAHYEPDAANGLFDETGNTTNWSFDASKLNDFETYKAYPAYAKAHGWSDDKPGSPHADTDIQLQWIMMGICLAIGGAALGWVLSHRGTRLVATEDELIGTDGVSVPFAQIVSINKAKWDSKGIAVVHYKLADGKEGSVKIDDWIYRDGDLVLEQVEQHTGLGDMIPGD